MRETTRTSWPAVLLFALALALTVATTRDYGLHWDSNTFLDAPTRIAGWILSFSDDTIDAPALTDLEYYFGRVHYHPPLYRILTGVFIALFHGPLGILYAARLTSAVAFSLTGALIYGLLRRRFSWDVALAGAALYFLFPRIFAFAHFNTLDLTMALWFLVAIVGFPALLERRFSLLWIALLYLVGYLLKVQGFFIPLVHFVWVLAEGLLARRGGAGKRLAATSRVLALKVALPALLAFLLLPVFWPYLILDHFRGLREYLEFIFLHKQINVLYFGSIYEGEAGPPWHYVLAMPAITIPLTTLVLLLLGGIRLARTFLVAPSEPEGAARLRLWFWGAVVPLGIMGLPGVPRFDGTRMLFMAYPFFALWAALGYGWAAAALERRFAGRALAPRLRQALLVLILFVPFLENLAVYPFQLLYYNALVGGPRGALQRGFDGDYLGCYAFRAYADLNRQLPAGTVLFFAAANTGNHYGLAAQSLRARSAHFALRPDLRVLNSNQRNVLVASRAPRYIFLGGRRAAYGEFEHGLIENASPVYERVELGVPLLRLYPVPEDDAVPAAPGEPLLEHGGAALLGLQAQEGGRVWVARWQARAAIPARLGLTLAARERMEEDTGRQHFPDLVPFMPTPFWQPGDVYRTVYELEEPIAGGDVVLAVAAEGRQPAITDFVAVEPTDATKQSGESE